MSRPAARHRRCAASVAPALYTMLYVYVRTRCVVSGPQDIAWGYYYLTNVSITCRGYLVTRCLLLDAGGGVCPHTTIVEVPKPFQSIKSCYNIDTPFYKGVPQPDPLDLDLDFYNL
jgi:hypothetical protein